MRPETLGPGGESPNPTDDGRRKNLVPAGPMVRLGRYGVEDSRGGGAHGENGMARCRCHGTIDVPPAGLR